MSDDSEFTHIAVNFFADQTEQATDRLVTLRAQLDTALTEGNEETIDQVSVEINEMVSSIPWGTIPNALLSLASHVCRERGLVLFLLDVLHAQVIEVRESVRDLEVLGVNSDVLVRLIDVAALMDDAITDVPYVRVGDE